MKMILMILIFTAQAFASYEKIDSYDKHVSFLKHASVNGLDIAYLDQGQGVPIVLLHGIPTNSWMFRKMIPTLVKSGYRVIAPDLIGMGQSERTKDENKLNIEYQAETILNLLTEKLKLTSWKHLVHDFGGPITWTMMANPRFAANELIILDTFLFKDGFSPGLNIFTKGFMQVMTSKLLRKSFFNFAIKSMVSDKTVATQNMLEGYVRPLQNGGAYTYKCLYFKANKIKKKLYVLQDNAYDYKDIPTKIIWGKNDKFLDSVIQLNQIKDFFATDDRDVHVLNNTTHLITEEKAQEIVDIITNKKVRR